LLNAQLELTRSRGHLILESIQRKEAHSGSSHEIPARVPA